MFGMVWTEPSTRRISDHGWVRLWENSPIWSRRFFRTCHIEGQRKQMCWLGLSCVAFVYLQGDELKCPVHARQLAYCSSQLDRWRRNYDLHNLSLSAEHTSGTGWRIEGKNGQDSQTSHDRAPRGMVVPDRGCSWRPAVLSSVGLAATIIMCMYRCETPSLSWAH